MQQIGRIQDPAAAGRYLFVGKAVDLVQELSVPAAGIHHVRVAVAESGHDHAALRVQSFFAAAQNDRGHRPEVHDPAVFVAEPGILQEAGAPLQLSLHPKDSLRLDARQKAYIIDKTHSE